MEAFYILLGVCIGMVAESLLSAAYNKVMNKTKTKIIKKEKTSHV